MERLGRDAIEHGAAFALRGNEPRVGESLEVLADRLSRDREGARELGRARGTEARQFGDHTPSRGIAERIEDASGIAHTRESALNPIWGVGVTADSMRVSVT